MNKNIHSIQSTNMGYSGAYIDEPLDSGEMAEDFHSVII